MRPLTKTDIWRDVVVGDTPFMVRFAQHVVSWRPAGSLTPAMLMESLARYLRTTLPQDAEVVRHVELGEAVAHVGLRYRGVLLERLVWLEVVTKLIDRDDYDRVVGRLAQLGVNDHEFLVAIIGVADDALASRLAEKYRRSRGDAVQVVRISFGPVAPTDEGISPDQVPEAVGALIRAELDSFSKGAAVDELERFPVVGEIPFRDAQRWIRVDGVVCVVADMRGSTRLSAQGKDSATAALLALFSNTAVKILHHFGADHVEVQGDGVFGLFDRARVHTALASALTANTFAHHVFAPRATQLSGVSIGSHVGMDLSPLLVRRIGLRRRQGRDDRQNEVWAGRSVNVANKLAGIAADGEILISSRTYEKLRDKGRGASCKCAAIEWSSRAVGHISAFDFESAYSLASTLCKTHGREVCQALLAVDSSSAERASGRESRG